MFAPFGVVEMHPKLRYSGVLFLRCGELRRALSQYRRFLCLTRRGTLVSQCNCGLTVRLVGIHDFNGAMRIHEAVELKGSVCVSHVDREPRNPRRFYPGVSYQMRKLLCGRMTRRTEVRSHNLRPCPVLYVYRAWVLACPISHQFATLVHQIE
jgi:hypothetical protein